MKMAITLLGVLSSIVSLTAATADDNEYTDLSARYSITNHNLMDLMPEDKRDRLAIFINGDDARKIYNAMLVPERRVDCDGKLGDAYPATKIAGGLECSKYERDLYSCTVAIMLDTGATERGYICDPQ
jgi:hypothetical protein